MEFWKVVHSSRLLALPANIRLVAVSLSQEHLYHYVYQILIIVVVAKLNVQQLSIVNDLSYILVMLFHLYVKIQAVLGIFNVNLIIYCFHFSLIVHMFNFW